MNDHLSDRRRSELLLVEAIAVLLVLVRAFVPAWFEGYDFNSDQAVVGLMAKHLAEGRAFPLFFYGQHYMLGVQAWIAAPFFLLGGANILMLRLPLVAINCAVALLLIRLLVAELPLRPAIAFVATLPFIMPPAVTASHLLQTLGASVEPLLYVLLLWALRRRPILFGLVLAVGFLHREFTIFAVPALIVVMILERSLFTRATAEHALTIAIVAVTVWVVVDVLKSFVDVYGPSTGPIENSPLTYQIASLASRVCLYPVDMAARARSVFVDCLSDLYGVRALPLFIHGLNSPIVTGSAAVGWPLLGTSIVVAARSIALIRRVSSVQPSLFCIYLAVVGVQTIAAYTTACEVSAAGGVGLIRYVLLALFLPVAVGAWYLRHESIAALKALVVAALLVWAAANLADNGRLVRQYATDRPTDKFRVLANYLVSHRIRYARADYWDAYVIDFMTRERVIVASTWKVRVREYQQKVDAWRAQAVTIVRGACPGGEPTIESWCISGPGH